MNVNIIPKIIKSRGVISFEDRRFTTSVSIASKSKFDYPPDYYVVHHEMGAMSGVLERIRDIKVAMVKLGMLLLDLFVFLIVFKCGVDSGGNYYLFFYPATGWIFGSLMAEWYVWVSS